MRNLIKAGIGSLLLAGSMLVATPAQAVAAHCNSTTYPNKVELSGDSASFDTNLPVNTPVCLKVGNEVVVVTAGAGGWVYNTTIKNQNGKLQGISYYAYGDSPYNPYP